MGKSPKDTGGPVVKTGPTAGENRSRNKDGEWRKKRSDSGKSKNQVGSVFLQQQHVSSRGYLIIVMSLKCLENLETTIS